MEGGKEEQTRRGDVMDGWVEVEVKIGEEMFFQVFGKTEMERGDGMEE